MGTTNQYCGKISTGVHIEEEEDVKCGISLCQGRRGCEFMENNILQHKLNPLGYLD